MLEDYWANAVFSITPTLLVGLIFWLVVRSIFRMDRTERKVYSQMEAAERARRGLAPRPATQSPSTTQSGSAASPGLDDPDRSPEP